MLDDAVQSSDRRGVHRGTAQRPVRHRRSVPRQWAMPERRMRGHADQLQRREWLHGRHVLHRRLPTCLRPEPIWLRRATLPRWIERRWNDVLLSTMWPLLGWQRRCGRIGNRRGGWNGNGRGRRVGNRRSGWIEWRRRLEWFGGHWHRRHRWNRRYGRNWRNWRLWRRHDRPCRSMLPASELPRPGRELRL